MTAVTDVRLPGEPHRQRLTIVDGRITVLETVLDDPDVSSPDAVAGEGLLAMPSMVEPHLHLDKAYLDSAGAGGTLEDAVARVARMKSAFDRADLLERGSRVLERAIVNGTTIARVHADVDPAVGTLSVEVLLELREAYLGVIELQVVAFAQEGISSRPGTLELLRESMVLGADVIGGCSYSEPTIDDCRDHVRTVLDLAERFGVPADFHADLADDDADPRYGMIGFLASQTIARGMQGQVTAGHVTSLAAVEPDRRAVLADLIARAGVAIVVLPATDLHLGGRKDRARVRRAIAPVRELAAAGVRVAVSSNNIRNPFTPYGNVDQFQTALLLAQTSHLSSREELAQVVGMASTGAAEILGVPGHRIQAGGRGDMILVDAADPAAALLDQSPRRKVLSRGRLIAETVVSTRRVPAATPLPFR